VRGERLRAAAIAAAIAAADQLAGWFVRRQAAHLPWTFGTGLAVRVEHNTGISFSRFASGGALLAAVIACVCVGLAIAVWRAPSRFAIPLAIVLGGAAGNLIDRVRFGYVVDYVAVGPWPTFNLGDVAIFAGAALIVVRVLWPAPRGRVNGEA